MKARSKTEKTARRFPAARLALLGCMILCAAILLYQSVDYLLSLRRDTKIIKHTSSSSTRSAALLEAFSSHGRMDINAATLSDLTQASGIGPALAQRILDYREQMGGFHFIEDLKYVEGIGDKRFEALKELFYCPMPETFHGVGLFEEGSDGP